MLFSAHLFLFSHACHCFSNITLIEGYNNFSRQTNFEYVLITFLNFFSNNGIDMYVEGRERSII